MLRHRRMIRAYSEDTVPRALLDEVIDAGLRAPTAGHSQGTEVVVLESAEDRARFWDVVAPHPKPGGRWAGLRAAPVIVLPLVDADAYVTRYAEPDKAGLGMDRLAGWPAPYWEIDLAFAVMSMLLAATAAGLGALFFAVPGGMGDVFGAFGIPAERHHIGAMSLGWPAPEQPRSPSVSRPRRPRTARVQYGPRA